MKRAIFRGALVFLVCIFTALAGFSVRSYANEIKGYAISTNSEINTLKKVNERIVSTAKDSKGYNSYVVNINDRINFTLATLLSLNDNGIVVGIDGNKIDDENLNILTNSTKVVIVGDENSLSNKLLEDSKISFTRLSSNKRINEFLGSRDLLIVDSKENLDILGALYFSYYDNMNIMIVDSNIGLTEDNLETLKTLKNSNGIYFYDGINNIPKVLKRKVYETDSRDISLINNYSLEANDIFKIFRDRTYSIHGENQFFITEGKSLVDILSAYKLAEKEQSGFSVVTNYSDLFKIEDILDSENFENVVLITSTEDTTFVNLRRLLGYLTGTDFAEIDIKDNSGNTISKPLIINYDKTQSLKSSKSSEEVNLKKDEVVFNGKVMTKEQVKTLNTPRKVEPIKTGTDDVANLKYSRVLTMTATAYTDDPAENGGYTITKLGTPLRHGVVAVDPKIIPLGSKLYIETIDGYAVYGYAVAEDTGSAIKGNKIDLFIKDKTQAQKFGRRQVKVYVLN